MRVEEVLQEALVDKIKAALGTVKGKVLGSMTSLVSMFRRGSTERLTTIEKFRIEQMNEEYLSRVDTGALVCALHCTDIQVDEEAKKVKFKHEGKSFEMTLLRMKEASNTNGVVNRPRVQLSYKWGGKIYSGIETCIVDRSKMKFKLLIGRNLIKELKLPVHISDEEVVD